VKIATSNDNARIVRYEPRGEAPAFLECRDPEVLYEGPAGTGKSYACLWKVHAAMCKYPGARALIVRQTLVSLTASALVTYQERVLPTGNFQVDKFGGSRFDPVQFRYPNGSVIVVGGMDNPSKIMSSEYDLAYVNEATELSENAWEAITTRLRYGVMPYQQLLADCNPVAPTHWLNQRAIKGITTRFRSTHEDNPVLWNAYLGKWTERGEKYIALLDRLTGVRYQRLRLGNWVAAEGQVYDNWSAANVVKYEDVKHKIEQSHLRIGAGDWGWTKPGVLQVWSVDHDGDMYLVEEVYQTRRAVESWWIPKAQALTRTWNVRQWFLDPSEPEHIAQFQHAGIPATGAKNDIKPGIDAVQDRIRPLDRERPRLFIVEGSTREVDPDLLDKKLPTSTLTELPEYIWPMDADGVTKKDLPIDANNHGLDTMRYAVAALDLPGGGVALDVDPVLVSQWDDL